MDILKPLFNESEIKIKIAEIAEALNRDYNRTENIVLLSILKGSLLFTADLIRLLKFEFNLGFLEISSYGDNKVSGELMLLAEPKIALENQNVVIIEDIIDTGKTVRFLNLLLEKKNAKSMEYVTLLIKEEKYQTGFPIKYPGFKIPDLFVAGYGMDCAGKYRNLPYIVTIHTDNRV